MPLSEETVKRLNDEEWAKLLAPKPVGPFTGKLDNEVLDVKIDYGGPLPSVEIAWKDVDKLIKERENESKPT